MKFNYIVDNNIESLKEKQKNLKIFSKENFKSSVSYLNKDGIITLMVLVLCLITLFTSFLLFYALIMTENDSSLVHVLKLVCTLYSIFIFLSLLLFFSVFFTKAEYEDLIQNYEKNLINEFESFYSFLRDTKNDDIRLNTLYDKFSLARYKYSIESLCEFIKINENLIKIIVKNFELCSSKNKKEIFNDFDGPSILLNLFNINFKDLNLADLEFIEKEINMESDKTLANNMKNELKEYLENELYKK